MLKFVFLSKEFFNDFPTYMYSEIERKLNRPYVMLHIKVDMYDFAIPMRSNIKHRYAFFTNKVNRCGIDFSKAVYISDEKYIDKSASPYIRKNEFKALLGKDYIIKAKFIKYIKQFVKANNSHDMNKNRDFKYSTLHYFKNVIDFEKILDDEPELMTI